MTQHPLPGAADGTAGSETSSSHAALPQQSNNINEAPQVDRQVPGAYAFGAASQPSAAAGRSTTDDAVQPLRSSHDGHLTTAEESLQDAALAIPDTDALSVSSLHTTSSDRLADEQTAAAAAAAEQETRTAEPSLDETVTDSGGTEHEMDWGHLLGLSGQGLSAANTATSVGFAAARRTTSFSLTLAKRFTQGLVALPAMALDGTLLGNAPSTSNYAEGRGGTNSPSIAQVAHAAVGGLFDVISTLALGGIDLGTAVTGAGLGAAVSGVEGVRRALGSEVLRSLGAFSRLVRREWNSASENLPPGGIPAYSILGITQAMTAWVSIQMVTREYYEKRMLRNLDVVDLEQVHAALEAAKRASDEQVQSTKQELEEGGDTLMTAVQDGSPLTAGSTKHTEEPAKKKKKKQVRILDDEPLPGDEGDVIDAEIGNAADAAVNSAANQPAELNDKAEPQKAGSADLPTEIQASKPTALTNEEAIAGLKRYSRLVLGVYGGVALAWLGSLPPDLMQAAGSTVEGEETTDLPDPNAGTSEQHDSLLSARPRGRSAAQDDEAEFLRAAASLDLDECDLIDDEAASATEVDTPSPNTGASTPRQRQSAHTLNDQPVAAPSSSNILFSADGGEAGSGSKAQPSPAQPARSWSYYDILMGTADADIFHRLGGLEHGHAVEGDYAETSSQAGSAADRLRRLQKRVARPSKPRYYVVTDHTQRKIVLVLRGSLTLGDIAIDLTCESANFDIDSFSPSDEHDSSSEDANEDEEAPAPAEDFSAEALREKADKRARAEERRSQPQARAYERSEYIVHEGMYETAKEIGEPGRPVHRAVRRAMLAHPGYALDITGHSLGAGVASLLALMWASPETGMTTKRSGLPVGRRTHAFCFAVPCTMGDKLGKRAEPLVTSYCYSYDLVCRLSLGAILDIRNACAWLAYENSQPSRNTNGDASTASTDATQPISQHYGLSRPVRLVNVMQRAFVHQSGRLNATDKADLEADFLALRKTLEANMTHVELYPPGVVLYSLPPDDVEPHLQSTEAKAQLEARLRSGRLPGDAVSTNASYAAAQKSILYRLRDDGSRADVFGQIINNRGMLSRHMPHIYHAAIDAL